MATLQSIEARTGQAIGAAWPESSPAYIDSAAQAAGAAAVYFAASTASGRGVLLHALADALEAERDALVHLADRETGLGLPRLNGELDRTIFQLRGFADVLAAGTVHAVLDDAAVPGAPPAGRPRLTRTRVPVGPVAMFSASNFPFAFSVLGGDTASALAAGCPVVVKGHPAHPALSRATAAIAHRVVAAQGLPAGVFQFVEGGSVEVGVALVNSPAVAAVAFTGSFKGGTALARVAADRPRPIPFYGELGSINPLLVLPDALQKSVELAATLAGSICLGAGQFCTSPGVIVVPTGPAGDGFVQNLVTALHALQPHAMLSAGIRATFERGVARWRASPALKTLTPAVEAAPLQPRPFLAETSAAAFIAQHELHEEVFGAAALVVRTATIDEAVAVLEAVGGSLTATLWGVDADTVDHRRLVRAATRIAGRVLFSGVPTGVAVTAAQQHGGPYPASTQPFTTSVGYAAVDRFLRPVALQDAPAWFLEQQGEHKGPTC